MMSASATEVTAEPEAMLPPSGRTSVLCHSGAWRRNVSEHLQTSVSVSMFPVGLAASHATCRPRQEEDGLLTLVGVGSCLGLAVPLQRYVPAVLLRAKKKSKRNCRSRTGSTGHDDDVILTIGVVFLPPTAHGSSRVRVRCSGLDRSRAAGPNGSRVTWPSDILHSVTEAQTKQSGAPVACGERDPPFTAHVTWTD
ncbi:hypothetical protein INR49_008960 [Caranx melampygus]|nr:hypothetical protein INR49_008960 [Caranx melampygus]